MGTVVDRNTLKAMIMEILSKDKELCKDVLDEIVKENSVNGDNNSVFVKDLEESVSINSSKADIEDEKSSISEDELDYWVAEHFKEYDAVFKALA